MPDAERAAGTTLLGMRPAALSACTSLVSCICCMQERNACPLLKLCLWQARCQKHVLSSENYVREGQCNADLLLDIYNAQAGSQCLLPYGLSAYHDLGHQGPSTASLYTYLVQESHLRESQFQGQQVKVGEYAKQAVPDCMHKVSTRKAY